MKNSFQTYNRPVDMSLEVKAILKTVLLLERDYAAGYLIRVVQGDTQFALRNESHKELETFGDLQEMFFGKIENLIYFLVKKNLLEVSNEIYGNISITKAGKTYLDTPSPIMISPVQLINNWYEIQLAQSYRRLRKEIALRDGCAPYQLFTNHTLRYMIEQPPHSDEELMEFAGMDKISFEERSMILDEVNRIMALKAIDDKTGIMTKAHSRSAQAICKLYESGMSVSSIAEEREVKITTVREHLFVLHRAGFIDLKPWIEENLDPKILHKGTEYFKQAKTPLLKEAHEVLGYAYEDLRMCKLYAGQFEEVSMKYAS